MGEPFVGRQTELDRLSAGLEGARAGRGRLFVLAGESGIGKTRLAEELSHIATGQGVSVFWGRCWEAGEAPAYWPWTQVLRQVNGGFDLETKGRVVGHGSEGLRFQLFDSVASFLRERTADKPLALVLDDLHAADESSLLLMQFLARGIASTRLLVVGTYSPDEARTTPTHAQLLAGVAREATRLFLRGLDRTEVGLLLEGLTGYTPPESVVDTMLEATDGNPFYVLEATRLYTTKGQLHRPDYSVGFRVPDGVKDVVANRLAPLSDELKDALSVASVIGRDFAVSLLTEVCGKHTGHLRDLLGEAVRAGIVEESSALGHYRFTHVLMRETLYEDLTPSRRMRLHHEIAQVLEAGQREDDDALLGDLAHHWFKAAQAGDVHKTISYAVRAAERARSLLAFEESARLYRRALKVASQAAVSEREVAELEAGLASVAGETEAPSVPELAPTGRNVFVKEADFWTIEFGPERARLRNTKELSYLAHLLANPGREIHVLDLLTGVGGRTERVARAGRTDDELRVAADDAGPVLDEQAKSAYRHRLSDLQEELEEAQAFNDPVRIARAKEEIDALTQQLAAAVGLGGRDRKTGSQAERARVSVQKTVKEALRRTDEAIPALGAHLHATIRTGTFCSYTPDPRMPIEWKL